MLACSEATNGSPRSAYPSAVYRAEKLLLRVLFSKAQGSLNYMLRRLDLRIQRCQRCILTFIPRKLILSVHSRVFLFGIVGV